MSRIRHKKSGGVVYSGAGSNVIKEAAEKHQKKSGGKVVGKVHGKKAKHRLDKKARKADGGAMLQSLPMPVHPNLHPNLYPSMHPNLHPNIAGWGQGGNLAAPMGPTFKRGGKVKAKKAHGGSVTAKEAVHKHEKHMHKGKPETKMKSGGMVGSDRNPFAPGSARKPLSSAAR